MQVEVEVEVEIVVHGIIWLELAVELEEMVL
jgi:hypothetical protein